MVADNSSVGSLSPTLDRAATGRASPSPRLARRLREATRAAHVRAEASFALDRRLLDRSSYLDLLIALRAYHYPLETALAAVDGWEHLEPAIDPRAYCRASLIDDDLIRLAEGADAPSATEHDDEPDLPRLPSLASALGCLYVLGGSALGGRIVAAEARRRLSGSVPVTFFASGGRSPAANWRALQATLDSFGAGAGATVVDETVHAALATFETLGSWLARDVRAS